MTLLQLAHQEELNKGKVHLSVNHAMTCPESHASLSDAIETGTGHPLINVYISHACRATRYVINRFAPLQVIFERWVASQTEHVWKQTESSYIFVYKDQSISNPVCTPGDLSMKSDEVITAILCDADFHTRSKQQRYPQKTNQRPESEFNSNTDRDRDDREIASNSSATISSIECLPRMSLENIQFFKQFTQITVEIEPIERKHTSRGRMVHPPCYYYNEMHKMK